MLCKAFSGRSDSLRIIWHRSPAKWSQNSLSSVRSAGGPVLMSAVKPRACITTIQKLSVSQVSQWDIQ
jgi:hypothetical protein